MIFYSASEIILIVLAAIVVDALVGDPPRVPHPVIFIGRLITALERRLLRGHLLRAKGILLTALVTLTAAATTWLIGWALHLIHPWLGYAAHIWLISTTIAVRGLRDAAMQVYDPLVQGDLLKARQYVGYIVGRDTDRLDEPDIARAAVETVAENTVDAFVSPVFWALIGAAPLAMLYRAANTLDSMVGYRNEKYRLYGWASARFDDVLNWIPARIAGLLLIVASLFTRGASAARAASAVRTFARLHPSPNSGIPESAAAGALGIQLGGLNTYGGVASRRAEMGWPLAPIGPEHILRTIRLMHGVRNLIAGGLLCVLLAGHFVI